MARQLDINRTIFIKRLLTVLGPTAETVACAGTIDGWQFETPDAAVADQIHDLGVAIARVTSYRAAGNGTRTIRVNCIRLDTAPTV